MLYPNINWGDDHRKNVVNNDVDISSLKAPWQNGPYKNQDTERHKNSFFVLQALKYFTSRMVSFDSIFFNKVTLISLSSN